MKEIMFPLRRFHGFLHEKSIEHIKARNYRTPLGKKAFIVGSPVYTNLGDSAILIAESLFLQKCGIHPDRIKEITSAEFYENRELLKRIIKKRDLIFGMGGGNMGNQWPLEEKIRYDICDDYPFNPMLVFPQTIFFVDNENRSEAEQDSIRHYNNRKNMTIVAREKVSEEIMFTMYPDCCILLTPDIVLSTTPADYGVTEQQRKGILFCCRSDSEKKIADSVWDQLKRNVEHQGLEYRQTDMYADCRITKENRMDCVRQKMLEFCKAELVITDRLHGMVFSAITGTPCVVFGNYNHKVQGTYEWIAYLPYVKYVESVEEAEEAISALLQGKHYRFDNSALSPAFTKLEKKIRELY